MRAVYFGLFAILVAGFVIRPAGAAEAHPGAQIAQDVSRGNCLACHTVPGDPSAITSANIGPPLVDMKARFPDRLRLRDQVWDATQFNPETVMPPYGKNRILTDAEIEQVVDYLFTK
jgi:L-cysteine S-thiosulfotransferase